MHNKRKWSLNQHRAQSPQFDTSVKYQNKLWILGFIISFFIGIGTSFILQVWIFPWLYDPHPNVNIMLDDKTDSFRVRDFKYTLTINTSTPIDDLDLWFLIPGVIKNIREYNTKTDCKYITGEQEMIDQNGKKIHGRGQVSIQCQRMGSDSSYYLNFDLNEENLTPISIHSQDGTPIQFPVFMTNSCSYYIRGVNDRIIKNNCNVNFTLSNTTMNSFIKRGIRLFNTPVNS